MFIVPSCVCAFFCDLRLLCTEATQRVGSTGYHHLRLYTLRPGVSLRRCIIDGSAEYDASTPHNAQHADVAAGPSRQHESASANAVHATCRSCCPDELSTYDAAATRATGTTSCSRWPNECYANDAARAGWPACCSCCPSGRPTDDAAATRASSAAKPHGNCPSHHFTVPSH